MTDAPTLVSACLLGARCRYDGASKPVLSRDDGTRLLPVCPEMMAGLGVPRPAIERGIDGRVRVIATGEDVTTQLTGASHQIVQIAQKAGVTHAILKERSPSCGSRWLNREGHIVVGEGILTSALRKAGITVMSEEEER